MDLLQFGWHQLSKITHTNFLFEMQPTNTKKANLFRKIFKWFLRDTIYELKNSENKGLFCRNW